jgi:hypothetical protein
VGEIPQSNKNICETSELAFPSGSVFALVRALSTGFPILPASLQTIRSAPVIQRLRRALALATKCRARQCDGCGISGECGDFQTGHYHHILLFFLLI